MKLAVFSYYCVLSAFLWTVFCELSADEITNLLQLYEVNINASLTLSKVDRELLSSWAEQHQVKQVNVTTRIRLQMSRHKEHSFKRASIDQKWNECMDFYSDHIRRSEKSYYGREASCLKNSNDEGQEKRQTVDQIEREIKKWRKSYKYLLHLCEIDNTNDEEGTKACLVDYIERDNYNSTLQRLIILKLEAMGELYLKLESAIDNLEKCLRTVFSDYLNRVRSLMHSLNKCYDGKNEE